jgi:WD40 repeat protein
VTGSEGGSIQLWESQGQEPLLILENRGLAVLSLALSPDGKRVLSGWQDGVARISNLEGSGQPAVLCEPMGDVLSAAAHAQARRIVLASADCLVWVWDTNGERLKKLAGHTATVTAVALSPDGRIATSGSLDGSVRIWDLESGTTLRVLTGHTKGILSVAICPDGKAALSGSADGTVRLWDLETGKQLRVFSGVVAESLAVSPDGRTAIIALGSYIELLPLLGRHVPLEPPLVHAADGQDLYGEFAALYQSVGLRVIREGPGTGGLELA